MLQMLRTAAATVRHVAASRPGRAPRKSPYTNYMLYQDGTPFMVINAPSLDHARMIVAGFSADHTWMLVEQQG